MSSDTLVEVGTCLFLVNCGPIQTGQGVVFSCCHQLLLLITLVFHQAGITEVLEITDKEDLYCLKIQCTDTVFVSLSFLHSKIFIFLSFSVLQSQCQFLQCCLNIVDDNKITKYVSWHFISHCLSLLCALFLGKKWPQYRHPSGNLLLKIPFPYCTVQLWHCTILPKVGQDGWRWN